MSHADHEWAREQIQAHLAGGLSADERARLEKHLAVCAECIAETDAGRRFDRAMDDLFAPIRPKPGLEERVIRSLRTAPARRSWPLVGRVVMGVAAVLVLGVIGLVIMESESPTWVVEGIASNQPRKPAMGWQVPVAEAPAADRGRYADYAGAPPPPAADPVFRERELKSALEMAQLGNKKMLEGLTRSVDRKDSDHNETADEEFAKSKGDSLDFVSDKPFKGKGIYDTIGGIRGPAPASAPAEPRPDDAVLALKEVEGPGQGQAVYKYRDSVPEKPNLEARYFKPETEKNLRMDPKPAPNKLEPPATKAPMNAPAKPQAGQEAGKAPAPQQPQAQEEPKVQRKIIRSGEVEFEVEGFDSSVATVTKIAEEERGFVATVNSDKLPNGKVRGVVVVRCPPENLDRLLLKLRALGELKSQNIRSQDVTKQYTDLGSQLRAAKTMEERLIKIIQEGKGEIKDLLAAEKELGVWRTKIEQLTGEMRYYDNLASLSTLTITLTEKEIRTPFGVTRTERVEMALEVEDVEKIHREALAVVADAKGRVTRSELKQHAAGQFNSIIEFEVTPTSSGPVRDQLKQKGNVARLDIHTQEETEGGSGRTTQEVKVTQKDSKYALSIYNLANIQPRETVHLNLAATDAEKSYRDILARAEKAGARIIASNLNRQKNDQTTGSINFEVKSAEAEAVLTDIRILGEVMRLTVTENPDTANVTKSKRAFQVGVFALGTVAPRESVSVRIGARNVPSAHKALAEVVRKAEARVAASQVNQGDPRNLTATLSFEVRRAQEGEIEAGLAAAGETLVRVAQRAEDNENVIDSKVRYSLTLVDLANLQARESSRISLATKDVAASYRKLQEEARKVEAWIHVSTLNESDRQNVTAALTIDVRREQESAILAALGAAGTVYSRTTQRSPEGSGAIDSKSRYEITFFDLAKIPPRETHLLGVEVGSVDAAVRGFEGLVAELKGRVIDRVDSRQGKSGLHVSRVTAEVSLAAGRGVPERLKELGTLTSAQVNRNPQAPENELAVARLEVTLSNDLIIAPESGPWANIKKGLGVSLVAGSYALMLVIVGVCFVLPIALVAWLAWKGVKKLRAKPVPAA